MLSKCSGVRYSSRWNVLRMMIIRVITAQPGEDRPDDEIGREDGAVPAGNHGHAEVPGHDGVHRHRHRDDQGRHQGRGLVVDHPLAGRAAPPHGQDRVERPPPACGAVAGHGQVGEHPQVEKEAAADDIGCDCHRVPEAASGNWATSRAGWDRGSGRRRPSCAPGG